MRAEKAAGIDETCSVACSTSIGELHESIYAPFAIGSIIGRLTGVACWCWWCPRGQGTSPR